MLVLSRRASEQILIGDNIIVSVERVDGGRVKIGITAPQDVPVWRGEVHKRIQTEGVLREYFDRQPVEVEARAA